MKKITKLTTLFYLLCFISNAQNNEIVVADFTGNLSFGLAKNGVVPQGGRKYNGSQYNTLIGPLGFMHVRPKILGDSYSNLEAGYAFQGSMFDRNPVAYSSFSLGVLYRKHSIGYLYGWVLRSTKQGADNPFGPNLHNGITNGFYFYSNPNGDVIVTALSFIEGGGFVFHTTSFYIKIFRPYVGVFSESYLGKGVGIIYPLNKECKLSVTKSFFKPTEEGIGSPYSTINLALQFHITDTK